MGITGRSRNNIKLQSRSSSIVNKQRSENSKQILRRAGFNPRGLSSELVPIVERALHGNTDELDDYISNPENIQKTISLFENILDYGSADIKNLSLGWKFPLNENNIEILRPLLQRAQKEGFEDFYVGLLANSAEGVDAKTIQGLPEPYSYLWLANSDDKKEVLDFLSEVMLKDEIRGNSNSTRVAYGYLLKNNNLAAQLQGDFLNRGLEIHKDCRDVKKIPSPFSEFLGFAFENAPLSETEFNTLLEKDFPISRAKKEPYTYDDLKIVSNLFYNENISEQEKINALRNITQDYNSAENLNIVALQQFFESLNYEKISPGADVEVLELMIQGFDDAFMFQNALQSFARNPYISENVLERVFELSSTPGVLESLAKNTSTPEKILRKLSKKAPARVKRFASNTLTELGF